MKPSRKGKPVDYCRKSYGVLQAGRFLAALVVVGFHANATLSLPKYLGVDPAAPFRAGFAGIQYFFVLSGLVIAFAHQGEAGQPGMVVRFARKRAWRLLPPLWAALLLSFVLNAFMGAIGQITAWDIISAMLMLPAAQEPLLAVEWTLRHELLFYLTFAIYLWRPAVGIVTAAAMILLSVWGGFARGLDFPWSFFSSPNHLLFALGAIVLPRVPRPRGVGGWMFLALGFALFAMAWSIACGDDLGKAQQNGPLVWLFGAGAALMILGSLGLEDGGALVIGKWGRLLGDASYSIYLVHFLFVSAACKLAMAARLPGLIAFLFVISVGLAGGLLFYAVVERPLRSLIGRRPA
jgi:peptidoglycan/LPS O-acetylase OafA/YrhL